MRQAYSFRDPGGFVTITDNKVIRHIRNSYAGNYNHLMHSGLYERLVEDELLIQHEEHTLPENGFYKTIHPERIDFISLPFEWTMSQWQEVVLMFLKVNIISLEYGMILKDATPFNITFYKGKPIFFDTLSFETYREGQPWMAYRQFCETMLSPLTLMHYNGNQWGTMLLANSNGPKLDFVSKNLRKKSLFNLGVVLHIHLHAWYQNKNTVIRHHKNFSKEKTIILLQSIKNSIKGWSTQKTTTEWSDYYATGIDSKTYLGSKIAVISKVLTEINPNIVIDLGANTGKFSVLASYFAKQVIAVESDYYSVEVLRQTIKKKKIRNLETVVADITHPTPYTGWKNLERSSLLSRLTCDLLLALALIHHLCIAANIPLQLVAELFATMTKKHVLIEFVPKNDERVKGMLANRADIFDEYTEENFIQVFSEYFNLITFIGFEGSHRKLFVWEKK
ncbi:MAG: hypothetical protein JWN76_1181 [Chitinophagaceae bacterium]|nr:hypothetical protein [Chitinophagaceae bacterium]